MNQANNQQKESFSEKVTLDLSINEIRTLLGDCNQHLTMIEKALKVRIKNRGDDFQFTSENQSDLKQSINCFYQLVHINKKSPLTFNFLAKFLQENALQAHKYQEYQIKIGSHTIFAKSPNQAHFIENLNQYAINFATGPAGCGKSWLSVAYGLSCFDQGLVERIVLCRPVLEAGEKLGFLPGDLNQKIDPFLKPLLDALYEMYPIAKVARLLSQKIIEILPLAYMRGRTLNESIIILDEAQNTTATQMKMFLTRMGYNSRLIISGDLTQNDLPQHTPSGLPDAINRLKKIKEIGFCQLDKSDIVRHPLVQKIVESYETRPSKKSGK